MTKAIIFKKVTVFSMPLLLRIFPANPAANNMQVRLNGGSKMPVGVTVWLSVSILIIDPVTYPSCNHLSPNVNQDWLQLQSTTL